MPPSPSPRARSVTLLGLVWLLGVSLYEPSATRLDVWPWAGLASVGWLVFAFAAWMRWMRPEAGPPAPFFLGATLAYAAGVVLSAATGPWPEGSLAFSLTTLGGTGLLFLTVQTFRDESHAAALRSALDLASAALIAVGLYAWSRQIAAAPSWAAVWGGRNPVPFGHSVQTAGAALLAGSWLTASAVHARTGRAWRFVAAAGAFPLLISTSSRAGVAALAATAILALTAVWLHRGRRTRDAVIGAAVLLALVCVGIGTNERLRELVVHGQWNAVSTESNQQRLAMAHAALTLGQSHGLLGPGPGTVPLAYGAGQARVPAAPDGSLQLHSAPLQVWATTGPVGAFALIVMLASLLPRIVRALRDRDRPDLVVAASGLLGYGLFSLTDHQFDQPFILVLVIAHIALLTRAEAKGEQPMSRSVRWAVAALVPLLLAGPVTYRARDLAARASFAAAADAHDAGRHDETLTALDTAAQRAPWDRFYLEAAAAWSWDQNPSRANALLRRVLSGETPWRSEFATYNLAWLELARGDPRAPDLFGEAAWLAPHRTGVFLGMAFALAASGDQLGANRAFARQLVADPRLITTALWDEPGLRARWPQISAELRALARDLEPLLSDESQRQRLREQVAIVLWWNEPSAEARTAQLPHVSTSTRSRLEALTSAPAAGQGVWPGSAQWGLLGETWATGRPNESLPADLKAALSQRLAVSRDFLAFVTARPLNPPWRHAYRVNRGGYRVIMRHPASPDVSDFPAFEENRLLTPHATALFAARGWIPGSVWSRLPALTRPPLPLTTEGPAPK